MILDAHHHLWRFEAGEYGWIGEDMGVLRRDYGPQDLEREMDAAGVDGAVSVQARASHAENEALLSWAKSCPRIRGVVGWVDFLSPQVGETLERYAAGEPRLRGFRHPLQDEPDPRFLLREDFNAGIAHLARHGFTYDILIREPQFPWVPEFVDRHPDVSFVLDHAGKPRIGAEGPVMDWRRGIREIARREGVTCKLSGLTTEVIPGLGWSAARLRPYVDTLLEAFGPGRLLFGSDWPVCRLRVEYGRWLETVRGLLEELSRDEQEAILGSNAARVYGLRQPEQPGEKPYGAANAGR